MRPTARLNSALPNGFADSERHRRRISPGRSAAPAAVLAPRGASTRGSIVCVVTSVMPGSGEAEHLILAGVSAGSARMLELLSHHVGVLELVVRVRDVEAHHRGAVAEADGVDHRVAGAREARLDAAVADR